MTSIVHISDTHFGTEVPAVVEALRQTVEELQPDVLILSGDITQRARSREFASALRFMDSLPARVKLVIPGNHDIPLYNVFTRFAAPYRNFEKTFGTRENIWTDGKIGIVCYDATSPYRHTRGALTEKALRTHMGTLKSLMHPDGIIIACAHQPLVTAWAEDSDETLIGRDETAHILSEYKVDLMLSGHVHVPLLTTSERHFPKVTPHFILAGAGTAVSQRVRAGAPNSFNLIIAGYQEGLPSITLRSYDFDAKAGRFAPLNPVRFLRTGQGWRESPPT